jgi:hypothetical protein
MLALPIRHQTRSTISVRTSSLFQWKITKSATRLRRAITQEQDGFVAEKGVFDKEHARELIDHARSTLERVRGVVPERASDLAFDLPPAAVLQTMQQG